MSLFSSITQLCPTLRPYGLEHPRHSCSLPTPRACSNSCPSRWWCHPTISSSVVRFSSHLQSFPASGLFQWLSSSHQVAKVLKFQLQHQFFQWIFRIDFPYDWLDGSPCSPSDSQESSPTPQFKSINSSAFFMVQLSHLYMTTGKTVALTRWTFVSKVVSLCFLIWCLGWSYLSFQEVSAF